MAMLLQLSTDMLCSVVAVTIHHGQGSRRPKVDFPPRGIRRNDPRRAFSRLSRLSRLCLHQIEDVVLQVAVFSRTWPAARRAGQYMPHKAALRAVTMI
jgi:hypothetical protein